jgi:hypothetical protein
VDDPAKALRFHQQAKNPGETPPRRSRRDWYPSDVFLADLTGTPVSQYTDKEKFFGAGDASRPEAVVSGRDGEIAHKPDVVMPYCMVLRRDVRVEPGESADLRFAYGTVPNNGSFAFLDPYRTGAPFADMIADWKGRLAYFTADNHPELQREMAWHAYYLQSSIVYNEFYKTFVPPQGSAYLYLHGSDGAPRDQALFTLALDYFDSALARDALRLIMGVTDPTEGQIQYAFAVTGSWAARVSTTNRPISTCFSCWRCPSISPRRVMSISSRRKRRFIQRMVGRWSVQCWNTLVWPSIT